MPWSGNDGCFKVIESSLKWQVGNGESIDIMNKFWKVPWFGNDGCFKVKDLMDDKVWDYTRIANIYPWLEVMSIQNIIFSLHSELDKFV